jgi:L-alanine-DL-glutamate epimerase-like enolase superfamily enzyme
VIPDDYAGMARVGVEGGIAVAGGENLHTIHEFQLAFDHGRLDYPEPDASNIGGVTGWLKVAKMCEARNLPVCSHGMQELHVSLLAAVHNAGWMEVHSFPIDRYTVAGPVRPTESGGRARAPDTVGTGVEFDMSLLAPFEVPLR